MSREYSYDATNTVGNASQVQRALEGLAVRKVIVVPGKIVNIVAA
jgi:leucyl-tRNA synthetase